jgi:hypothetical protein
VRVKTFAAGSDTGAGDPDSREWVFGLLASARHRRRVEQLEQLDLRRRPGCEPCLRALVTGEWTQETLFHVGWCDSCGEASIALGDGKASGEAGAAWYGRRTAWLAVAALAVVAVPLVASQVTGSDQATLAERGGVASAVHESGTAGAAGTAGTPATPGASGSSGTSAAGGGTVVPLARSKSSSATSSSAAVRRARDAHAAQHGRKALPLTP